MKAILFISILVFSLNVNAQSKVSVFNHLNFRPGIENENFEFRGLKSRTLNPDADNKQNIRRQIFLQNSLVQLYDSIYFWDWDTQIEGWQIYSKYIDIIYDGKNNLISGTYQDWDGFEWINSEKDSALYDSNNNLVYSLIQFWNEGQWENYEQKNMSYDQNNNLIREMLQDWSNNEWVNMQLSGYDYDENNTQTLYLRQNWNGSQWENVSKDSCTIDTENSITKCLALDWIESEWKDNAHYTYFYDVSNNLIKDSSEYFNGATWTSREITYEYDSGNRLIKETNYGSYNFYQSIYTYDPNGNLIKVLSQNIVGDSLVNSGQNIYAYDVNNNLISELYEYWNESSWVIAGLDLYGFDVNNFKTSQSLREYDESGTKVTTGDSVQFYYYTLISANEELNNPSQQIKIYPNPATDYFEISASEVILSIRLFNNYGQLQLCQSIDKSQIMRIAVDMLPAGIYYVEIKTRDRMFRYKLIIN